MTTILSSSSRHPGARFPGRLFAPIARQIKAWLPATSLVAVALAFACEVVHTAAPDAPVGQATFDVAPQN